jgi:intracellular septation protein
MQFLLEYAPIILFFVAYKLKDIYFATAIAIGASIVAIAYAYFVQKKVTAIQWVSLAIIVVFGGATLLLHDETFIKWKPSALYGAFAVALLIGKLVFKANWIDILFKHANIQAPAPVWTRITWAWIAFFIAMATLNGYVATNFSLDAWVNFKVWWAMAIFFVFTIANVLVLSKYMVDDKAPGGADVAAKPSSDA